MGKKVKAKNIDIAILLKRKDKYLPLAKKIYDKRKEGSEPDAYAFIMACLSMIYNRNFSEKDFEGIITDGEKDGKIDAIYIHDNYIDIFDFKEKDSCSESELLLFQKYLNENVFKTPSDYSLFNDVLKKNIKKIHKIGTNIYKKRIYVVRPSKSSSNPHFDNFKKEMEKHGSVEKVFFYNIEELIKGIFSTNNYLEKWDVKIKDVSDIFFKNKKELFFKTSLVRILDLYKKCITDGLDLFEKNVRYFLANKKISEDIILTIKNEPEKFYIYHNGITMTADSIYEEKTDKFLIKHPQIINGAQTINSIYRYYEGDLNNNNLKKAEIICKIIVADDTFSSKLCRTTNTQLAISYSDLKSNDNFQIKLQHYIEGYNSNFKYVRKKGKNINKKYVKIKMTDFMQWSYSCIFKKPAKAKNDKKSLFDDSDTGLYTTLIKTLNNKESNVISDICNIGVFLGNKIKNKKNKKEDKRFLRYSDLHVIAGIFNCKDKNDMDSKYNNILKILKEYQGIINRKDPDLSLNDIFTKSEKAWEYLYSRINK